MMLEVNSPGNKNCLISINKNKILIDRYFFVHGSVAKTRKMFGFIGGLTVSEKISAAVDKTLAAEVMVRFPLASARDSR